MPTNAHTPVRGARRRIVIALCAATVVVAGIGVAVPRSDASQKAEIPGSYMWPVKPFDRQHAVRGGFGDPRTIFSARATLRGVMSGGGEFSFHRGIDISAPNGSPVYPVKSGVVSYVDDEWVRVNSDGARAFEYWHIQPRVRVGEQVSAHETVLGTVMRPARHVHLTEIQNGRYVNPLAPGHIAPYRDRTTPRVTSIQLQTAAGAELLPNRLQGRVSIVAGAEDDPTIQAPGEWAGLPVVPALLTWQIRTWAGKAAVESRIGVDFRLHEPRDSEFWSVYARGTYQNAAAFHGHYSWGQRGNYLFKLAMFDTRRLRNGAYDVVVTATDVRGNRSSSKRRFLVAN